MRRASFPENCFPADKLQRSSKSVLDTPEYNLPHHQVLLPFFQNSDSGHFISHHRIHLHRIDRLCRILQNRSPPLNQIIARSHHPDVFSATAPLLLLQIRFIQISYITSHDHCHLFFLHRHIPFCLLQTFVHHISDFSDTLSQESDMSWYSKMQPATGLSTLPQK